MRRLSLLTILLLTTLLASCGGYKALQKSKKMIDIPWEADDNYTPTYHEVIDWYEGIANASPLVTMQPVGMTDAGYPLHEVVLSNGQGERDKVTLMINNAIHPGEPCGVNASIALVRDIVADGDLADHLDRVTIVIIPFYNIGGGLNRGSYSRANQVGPSEHGFRGNARHLDLNRDFIKADSRNARAFTEIYQRWRPEIFVDTHTSNGADYQYVMTLIATQKDKLSPPLATYQQETYLPDMYKQMAATGYEMIPYVYTMGSLDKGIKAFLDLPRYSSGYAALHGAISCMPETHMLKTYEDRVSSTYEFLKATLIHASSQSQAILAARAAHDEHVKAMTLYDLQWELDKGQRRAIDFKGYAADYKASEISGQPRLYYDRTRPYTRQIDYYDTYRPTVTIEAPAAYVVPFAYGEVIDRLRAHHVQMTELERDTMIDVQQYRILDYKTVDKPYEGHYLHYDVEVDLLPSRSQVYRRGDVIVYLDQVHNPYIIHTLEPQGADSFFAWNFFDGILMQKEHFSAYVFEDTAVDLLAKDADLRRAFDAWRSQQSPDDLDGRAELQWIYEHSPYYEEGYLRYPVGRVAR